MALDEALYGRKCQSLLCWYEPGERSLLGLDLGLVWYCCGFLKAVELSRLSKNYSQKVIVILFSKIT